jgi:hypothetical protein
MGGRNRPSDSFPRRPFLFSLALSLVRPRFLPLLLFSLKNLIRNPAPARLMNNPNTARKKNQFKTHLFLNSSGTSTDGFPSAFSFASTFGFSSCSVRDGLETYGRVDLHSYIKWPVPRHFWHTVDAVARGLLSERRCGAYLDMNAGE